MAYRPNPEELTPYEELGGGLRDPSREDDDSTLFTLEVPPISHTTSPPERKRRRTNRRGGRGANEPDNELDIEPTFVQRTPEERAELLRHTRETREYYTRHTALTADTPAEQLDEERRGALRWAASLAAEANVAYGAAHILSDETDPRRERMGRYRDEEHATQLADGRIIQAEELVLSACRKCIFIDRCELAGAEMHVVRALGNKSVRDEFVDAMSGSYGSSYVSCESVIKP